MTRYIFTMYNGAMISGTPIKEGSELSETAMIHRIYDNDHFEVDTANGPTVVFGRHIVMFRRLK